MTDAEPPEVDRVVEVPLEDLSPETLRGIVEEFVTRESTDYGAVSKSFEEKVADVLRQLHDGRARIIFDPNNESIQLQPARPSTPPICPSPKTTPLRTRVPNIHAAVGHEVSSPRMLGRPTALALFAAALLPRLLFVLWAPAEPAADGLFYHAYGEHIARGWGYIDLDGSPVVRWMPGWPLMQGGLYAIFGSGLRVALFANAAFDAATAVLVAALGARWFGRRTGLTAGALYAAWPGMIFFCGTHMSEPLFNLLLVAALLTTTAASQSETRRLWRFGAAGLCLGGAALVKAEPLVMVPGIALCLWQTRRSTADFARTTSVLLLVAASVLAPWTLRNWLTFERFIPTAASGGIGVYLANHPGATGGQDFLANRSLQQKFKYKDAAWTAIRRNDAGWRDAWAFVRANPGEELRIVGNKLRLTYLGDARGAKLVRGLGPEAGWQLRKATWLRLRGVANAWWFMLLALAAAGLTTRARWPTGTTALLLFGVLLPWFCLHVVFLGGPRYHVPQIPVLALLAALGLARLTGVHGGVAPDRDRATSATRAAPADAT